MTVAELRAALDSFPDEAVIVVDYAAATSVDYYSDPEMFRWVDCPSSGSVEIA